MTNYLVGIQTFEEEGFPSDMGNSIKTGVTAIYEGAGHKKHSSAHFKYHDWFFNVGSKGVPNVEIVFVHNLNHKLITKYE